MRFAVTLGFETLPVEVVEAAGRYRVRLGEEWLEVDARLPAAGPVSLLLAGRAYLVDLAEETGEIVATVGGAIYRLQVEDAGRRLGRRRGDATGAGQRLVSPMPGRVVAVHVRPGDPVEPDAPLVVLEAMKMENEFRATAAGVVAEVPVTVGQAVNAGDLLVVVRPPP
jgi:glutaconyl-CoA/methylmalonyl-CoA decarboxylase subunit gamma